MTVWDGAESIGIAWGHRLNGSASTLSPELLHKLENLFESLMRLSEPLLYLLHEFTLMLRSAVSGRQPQLRAVMPAAAEPTVVADVPPCVLAHLAKRLLSSAVACMSLFTHAGREFTVVLGFLFTGNLNHVFFRLHSMRQPGTDRKHLYESDLSPLACNFIGDWAEAKIKFFQVEIPENNASTPSVTELPHLMGQRRGVPGKPALSAAVAEFGLTSLQRGADDLERVVPLLPRAAVSPT